MDNRRINRFVNTLIEISDKIKANAKLIDTNKIFSLIDLILEVHSECGMIFVYGAGRSGFIGRCFAQRLMHLGINSCFVSDAVTHQYTNRDVLIIISGSGETTSPLAITQKAKKIGGKIALFTGNPESSIGNIVDLIIIVEGKSKDKAVLEKSLAPYTSLFDISTLAILDSIGGTIMNILEVTEEDIEKRHASIE